MVPEPVRQMVLCCKNYALNYWRQNTRQFYNTADYLGEKQDRLHHQAALHKSSFYIIIVQDPLEISSSLIPRLDSPCSQLEKVFSLYI